MSNYVEHPMTWLTTKSCMQMYTRAKALFFKKWENK